MTQGNTQAYCLDREIEKAEGGDYEDLRIKDGIVHALNSEHYYSEKEDWMGILKFTPEFQLLDKFGYGHNHSAWKKMSYRFDDITHDEGMDEEFGKLVGFAARMYGVTEKAVLLNPFQFLYPIRDKLEEKYNQEVKLKNGILVKPVSFDMTGSLTYIVDVDQSTVFYYKDGEYTGRFGDQGIVPGKLLQPSGIKAETDKVSVLDFPTVPGEYFVDKPCHARIQSFDLSGNFLEQQIMENLRLKPSEFGQTALEMTDSRIYISNGNDLYVRGRDGEFVADYHIENSRITKLRAANGLLGVGFFEYEGILLLDIQNGTPEGFVKMTTEKCRYSWAPECFDFYGNEIYVGQRDKLQVYKINYHELPPEFSSARLVL